MRSFGDFLNDKYEQFEIDDVIVTMELIEFTLAEKHIMGVDDTPHAGMKKFRVVFKWPRSQRKAKAKTYDEEVRYVLAHSAKEARERIEHFVRNKRNKRFAGVKSNVNADYLTKQRLSRAQMEIKTKDVKSWDDFVKLCEFVVKKRPQNPLRYFDQNDLAIFIKKYRRSADFMEQLQKLSKPVQLLMKRIYFHVTQGDLSTDNHSELNAKAKYTDMTTKDVLARKAKGLGKHYPVAPLKDINDEPPSVGSVSEVIALAKSYGFTYKDLKDAKSEVESHEVDPLFDEKVNAYRDIAGRIQRHNMELMKKKNVMYRGSGKISNRNSMWDNDQGELDKWGGDTWGTELEREYPWLNSYGDGDTYAGIWRLAREGMPKKPPALSLWTKALELLLHYKRTENELKQEPWKPTWNGEDDEPIPF